MKRSWKILLLLVGVSFNQAYGCIEGRDGLFPKNNYYIPENFSPSGIKEEAFMAVINKISAVYTPIIKEMGGELVVYPRWSNGEINASAQRYGKRWIVNMYGGLARHKLITPDAFALVMCHEIGHHVGGAPRYEDNTDWASTEGQSDYFGTAKCFRKVFENDNNEKIMKKVKVPKIVKDKCEKAWGKNSLFGKNTNEYFLCLRNAMASLPLATLLAKLSEDPDMPSFSAKDATVVPVTYEAHPYAQCRLDTYFNGSLCKVSHNENFDNLDEVKGSCHQSTHQEGTRALCWFHPKEVSLYNRISSI